MVENWAPSGICRAFSALGIVALLTGCSTFHLGRSHSPIQATLYRPAYRSNHASNHVSDASRLDLKWPLVQVKVTSKYGTRDQGFHDGVDLRASIGTPIYAAEAGLVIYAEQKVHGYGRMVVLQHTGQVATVYAHNSKLMVHRGQEVERGQLIAYSGKSGARSPHLHFEVRRGVSSIDPMTVLPVLPERLERKKRSQRHKVTLSSRQ